MKQKAWKSQENLWGFFMGLEDKGLQNKYCKIMLFGGLFLSANI